MSCESKQWTCSWNGMWAVPETLNHLVLLCVVLNVEAESNYSFYVWKKQFYTDIYNNLDAEIKPKSLIRQVMINSQSEFTSLELSSALFTKQTPLFHNLQSRNALWPLIL